MRFNLTKRRIILVALFGFAILANIVWFCRENKDDRADFKIAQTNLSIVYGGKSLSELPYFNNVEQKWFLNARNLDDLTPFVVKNNDAHTGSGNYVLVRIEISSSTKTYKRVLQALLDQGICYVGVINTSLSLEAKKSYSTTISKILYVTDDAGNLRYCVDQFTPETIPQKIVSEFHWS